MRYRPLGGSGIDVSVIGLGGNTFGDSVNGDDATELIREALDLGITLIDTADFYSDGRSEELIGAAIRGRRDEVVLATKVGMALPSGGGGLSADWIATAAEGSLRRLGLDTIDLYQAHVPDPATPIDETLEAFDRLVGAGKVRYIGCSNHSAPQLRAAIERSGELGFARYVSVQPKWNLLDGLDDPDLRAACAELAVGALAHSALASGILTGKYRQGVPPPPGTRAAERGRVAARITDDKLAAVERVRPWVVEQDRTLAELGLAWVLANPEASSVLVGARTRDQLRGNVAAADWELSAADLAEVDRLVALSPKPGHR